MRPIIVSQHQNSNLQEHYKESKWKATKNYLESPATTKEILAQCKIVNKSEEDNVHRANKIGVDDQVE